ncbi:MAG: hypothetical protein HY917_04200 [Candidatus Diapherotrites archaeon]|nr:hypothetical protein [Candidatus Diapherotrites archaeon]
MAWDDAGEKAVLGRTQDDLEKYGDKGTAYLGKVVMSSGERPVLGRKVVCDIAKPHLMLICGKRGGGKCLDGDTEILLEDGSLKKIRELESELKRVVSLNTEYKVESSEKSGFFKRSVSSLFELRLRSGKKIRLTPEHPLLTIHGWVPAEEIGVGGRIATPRKLDFFGNGFLSEAHVKILAYLLAEGHIKRRAVWFTNSDEIIVSDFKLAVSQFDERMTVRKFTHSKYGYRVVNSNPVLQILEVKRENGRYAKGTRFAPQNHLRQWLIELGVYGTDSYTKFIPDILFSLPKPKVALFLNRFFSCDGTIYFDINKKAWQVSVASASERMIRQIQHLLLRFGIVSHLRPKKINLNGKEFHSFELSLQGKNIHQFLLQIGFFGKKEARQAQALNEIRESWNPNVDTIPKEVWDYYRPAAGWAEIGRSMGYKYPKSLRESMRYAPSRQKLLQIARADHNPLMMSLAESDIFWDEISSVTELNGEFEVYDITVPEFHNFVANDIIVHNSYSLGILIEEFAMQPPEIKRRLSVITIDTVGIFWTLKVPNKENPAELAEWGIESRGITARVLVPKGQLAFYKSKGLPVDGSFSLKASELGSEDWLALFKLSLKDAEGVLLTNVVEDLQESMGTYFSLDDLMAAVEADSDFEELTRKALLNRFRAAQGWGLFDKEGSAIKDLAKPGFITVIDVSSYRQSIGMEGTRDIIVGLLGKKLFEERMLFRKEEESRLIAGETRES